MAQHIIRKELLFYVFDRGYTDAYQTGLIKNICKIFICS